MLLQWTGLHTSGWLCDLGHGLAIFSAHIGGFVSVPTCEALAPSSSSDPYRVGLRGAVVHAVLRGVAPRQQLQAINEHWGCGLHACGLLYDLGYGPVIFSAHIGGFGSVRPAHVRLALRPRLRLGHLLGTHRRVRVRPHQQDPTPSSSSDPCRFAWRGWWYMRSSMLWHRGDSR